MVYLTKLGGIQSKPVVCEQSCTARKPEGQVDRQSVAKTSLNTKQYNSCIKSCICEAYFVHVLLMKVILEAILGIVVVLDCTLNGLYTVNNDNCKEAHDDNIFWE